MYKINIYIDVTEVEYKILQQIQLTSVLIHPDRSDRFTQPVEPVGTPLPTPPVRPVPRTGQTGLRKTERLNTLPSTVQPGKALA